MSKLNRVLRPGGECANFWRIFLQPIASLPITGDFDISINLDLDNLFTIDEETTASNLRAEIKEYFGGSLSDWDIKGGPMTEQTLVFCGSNFTDIAVTENRVNGARPYIWRRSNEL